MGILLCYNIYLHINTVDLSSERNTTENCLTSDAQTTGDEQIIQLPEILCDFGVKIHFSSFYYIATSFQPTITIWQPPRLC